MNFGKTDLLTIRLALSLLAYGEQFSDIPYGQRVSAAKLCHRIDKNDPTVKKHSQSEYTDKVKL